MHSDSVPGPLPEPRDEPATATGTEPDIDAEPGPGTGRENDLATEVLVVGAGPTGLMLAAWLARLGVDVLVADSKARPTRESRAVVIQARSMEIYDQLGLGDEVERAASPSTSLVPGFGRLHFGRVPLGELGRGLTPFPRLLVLEQSRNEAILYDALRRSGGDVLWRHGLVELHQEPAGGVVVGLRRGSGERAPAVTVRARYCVGADGGSSAVRTLLDIPFDGVTDPGRFFVCDALDVTGVVEGAVNARLGVRDLLLTFPFEGEGHHRVIGLVSMPDAGSGGGRPHPRAGAGTDAGPAADPEDSLANIEERARRRVADGFGVQWGESTWFATYRVHHRVAAAFRRGSVFLAGDAAHVHSPVGAQGMNTGLQDAHNLALKLAEVITAGASEILLDRYEAERRPVALRLVRTTDRLFEAVTAVGPVARLIRPLVAMSIAPVASVVIPRLRGASRLFEYVSQIRVHYWMAEGDRERAGGRRDPVVGRRLSYTAEGFEALRDVGWQVHEYGSVHPDAAAHLEEALGLPVRVFSPDPRRRLHPGVFYLVRPDGFVAAAATAGEAAEALAAALPAREPIAA